MSVGKVLICILVLQIQARADGDETRDETAGIALKKVRDPIPSGWRLVNFSELEKYKCEAKRVMGYWTIAKIGEGYRFDGRGWGYKLMKYGTETITQHLLIKKTGHPCEIDNGGCAQICIEEETAAKCACRKWHTVEGKSCVAKPTTYKILGCFKDDESSPAFAGGKYEIHGPNIQECYEIALSKGNSHFGLQDHLDGYKCWTHQTAGATYAKYGRTTDCFWGYGGRGTMNVYEIINKVPLLPVNTSQPYKGYAPPLFARVNLSDPIPAGWKMLDYKDVGKYTSEIGKLLTDDFIARMDNNNRRCDNGWKILGFRPKFEYDTNSYHCATGRILINKYILEDPSTYSSTFTLCGGYVPPHTKSIKYPETGRLMSGMKCTWTISRPGETFSLVLSKLNITASFFSDSCQYGFLQFEGEEGGVKYCGNSAKQHEFRVRGSVTINLNTIYLHEDTGTGFVLKIVNTTGQVNYPEPACKVQIFKYRSYRGNRDVYTKSGNLREQNDASSLKVSTGCCATLFTGENFTGNHRTFCESSQYVGGVFNDKASSIKIKRDEWHGGYTEVGCFNDRRHKWGGTRSSDAIRGKYKSYPLRTVIEDCYNRALAKRNTHFAIKANKDCYTSSVAHETYNRYGPATGCVKGRGGKDMITVYRLLPVCTWRKISPGCVSKHNIKRYSHKSVEQCQQLCAADDNCLSIEYGVNHGGSKKIYKPRNCVLSSGTNSRTCDGKKYNLDLYVKESCNPIDGIFNQKYRCHWISGTVYPGNYVKQDPQSTPFHCVSVCLTMKERNSDVNGVMIKKTRATFECWCIKKANERERSNDKSGYDSCILNLKYEHKDIDECDEKKSGKTHGCQHKCVNTVGSYKCVCQGGFTIADDGRRCIIHPSSMVIRMKTTEPIPYGWRLINLEELGLYRSFARKAMDEKSVARIGDGLTFFGSYYGYQIKKENYYQLLAYYRGYRPNRGEQLLIRKEMPRSLRTSSTIYSLCGGEVPSNVETIKYPETGEYTYSLRCIWNISRPGETIHVGVTKLDLHRRESCYDYLQIGSDGEKVCQEVPTINFVGHGKLSILFKTDGWGRESGFIIRIFSERKEGVRNFIASDKMIVPQGY